MFFEATLLVLVSLAGATAVGVWITVRRSLPMIEGELVLPGPNEPIRILRDERGVPTIQADGRNDLAFGLGFVHGQDRFFQMDGLRRYAAGELSEIFGPGSKEVCIAWDRRTRILHLRSVARQVVAALGKEERCQLEAYVAGVGAGLGSLKARPFEYLVLGEPPRSWCAEDSVLVILALFIDLQGDNIAKESARGVVRDVLPGPLAEFLSPRGSVSGAHRCAVARLPRLQFPAPRFSTSATSRCRRPIPRHGAISRTLWQGATIGPLLGQGRMTVVPGSQTTCTCVCACPVPGIGSVSSGLMRAAQDAGRPSV